MLPLTPPPASKRLSYFSDALALCTLDFPIFFIEPISERHVVLAGGGGSSKTGVHNQINVIELVPNKGACYANLVTKYQTPEEIPDAVMTAALMLDEDGITETSLVTGGTKPVIYKMKYDSALQRYNVTGFEILRHTEPMAEVKCIKYAPGKVLTGGIDGQLTCWREKRATNEIRAHAKEIDEIDLNLASNHLVTLSRGEGRFIIWNLSNFHKIHEYSNKDMSKGNGVNYHARSCRYAYDKSRAPIECGSHESTLLVACNPVPAKNQPCMIYKWAVKDNDYQLVSPGRFITADGIMAMTVSQDGQHVAIGTRSGGVSVFGAGNLEQIYKIEGAHHNAVTGLAFLPPKQESRLLTNCDSCPLLSVSIDRRMVLHRPRSHSTTYIFLKTILILIVIFSLFFALKSHYDGRLTS